MRRGEGAPPYGGTGHGPGKPGPYGMFPGNMCKGGLWLPAAPPPVIARQCAHWRGNPFPIPSPLGRGTRADDIRPYERFRSHTP